MSLKTFTFLTLNVVLATMNLGLASHCINNSKICPVGWKPWCHSCYALTAKKLKWAKAPKRCRSMGGEMMAPRSKQENDFVRSMMAEASGNDHWIACNDIEDEGKWICSGDSKYRNWLAGEPNDEGPGFEGSDCARMIITGEWRDWSCSGLYHAVCKCQPVSQKVPMRVQLRSWRLLASCLMGHVMREFPAKSINGCAVECSKEPGCVSFNVLQGRICQLNDVTRWNVSRDEFVKVTKPVCIYGEK